MKNLNIARKNKMTSREMEAKKIANLMGLIAPAQRVLDWQLSEGYETQAEYSRIELAKLNAKLAKLEA